MRLVLLALVVAFAAACDTPAPLEPTNPFDPEFTQGRIPTAPTDLTVSEATPTSITLTWSDNSSFETGYAVVEHVPAVGAQAREVVVATLPPDTETYTLSDLRGVGSHEYFVRALAEPNRPTGFNDPVSAAIAVRYPFVSQRTLDYPSSTGVPTAEFSGDGRTLFLSTFAYNGEGIEVEVFDVASGERLTEVILPLDTWSMYGRPFAPFPGDRVAVVGQLVSEIAEVYGPTVYVLSRDGSVESISLQNADDLFNCQPFSISPDGSQAASLCPNLGDGLTLYVWTLPSGEQTAVRALSSSERLVGLSPVYAMVLERGDLRAVQLSDGSQSWQASVERDHQVSVRFMNSMQQVAITTWRSSSFEEAFPVFVRRGDGGVAAEWTDPVNGHILAARENQVVYPVDIALGRGGFEGIVASTDRPEERRILSGIAGSPQAAYITSTGVIILGRQGWIHEWDFSRPWEALPASGA